MNAAAFNRDLNAPIRKYELGRPVVRREQRAALEKIHRALAQTWSEAMAEYLPRHAAMEFEGLEFDAFSSAPIAKGSCVRIALFTIVSTPISGFIQIDGELARFLVSARLGLKSAGADLAGQPFTRIEMAIAHEMTRAMLARLGEAYAAAGLGSLCNIRECSDLADSFAFAPEDYMALLKFRLCEAGEATGLVIGLTANVLEALSRRAPMASGKRRGRGAIVAAVRQLPIDIDVVLGRWTVPVGELAQLQVGDRIVLPEGEDAWLASRGVRIRHARVDVDGNGAAIQIRHRARMR